MPAHRRGGAPFRLDVLSAGGGEDGEEEGGHHIFPRVDVEGWRESLFQLVWHQHGGSGVSIAWADALEMAAGDRDWLLERMSEQREREAKQIEKAGKRKRS